MAHLAKLDAEKTSALVTCCPAPPYQKWAEVRPKHCLDQASIVVWLQEQRNLSVVLKSGPIFCDESGPGPLSQVDRTSCSHMTRSEYCDMR